MRARDNPFATRFLDRIKFRFLDEPLPVLLERLEAGGYRGAIVGPHGSGKTTLIEQLQPLLADRGFLVEPLRLSTEQRSLAAAGAAHILARATPRHLLLLDGAEQLSWLAWRQFRRRAQQAGGLIVTTHTEGRLPTLLRCRTTPELLHQLANQLSADIPISDELARLLFRKHGGNLRDCLRELYDQFAVVVRQA